MGHYHQDKMAPTDWEKTFTNPISNTGLESNLYSDSREPNNSIKIGVQTYIKNSQLRNIEWPRST